MTLFTLITPLKMTFHFPQLKAPLTISSLRKTCPVSCFQWSKHHLLYAIPRPKVMGCSKMISIFYFLLLLKKPYFIQGLEYKRVRQKLSVCKGILTKNKITSVFIFLHVGVCVSSTWFWRLKLYMHKRGLKKFWGVPIDELPSWLLMKFRWPAYIGPTEVY